MSRADRPDVALVRTLAQIADDSDALVGQKVRVCGRILAYDRAHGRLMLWSGEHALLVDARLCVDAHDARWLAEPYGVVLVVGYLERIAIQPTSFAFAPPAHLPQDEVRTMSNVQVQAIIVRAEPHVDVREWEETVSAMAAHGALAAPR